VSRASYAGLFAVIGTAHGAGDGSTTFHLPDLRGRVAAGKDDMGGSSAARLNSMSSTTLGASGGAQTESASISGTASGGISVTSTGMDTENVTNTFAAGSGSTQTVAGQGHVHGNVNSSGSANLSVSGSTASVTNVQPTMILNYLIRI
jgi:microcystin-dependent protein